MSNTFQTKFEKILEFSHEEIYVFDAKTFKFLQFSKGSLNNLGYTTEEMLKLSPFDIKPEFTNADFQKLLEPLVDGTKKLLYFETKHRRKDNTEYFVDVRIQYIPDDEPVFLSLVTDITERKKTEEELKYLAFHDSGSNLYNRHYFLNQLDISAHRLNRSHSPLGIILVDLDHFGSINNSYGHIFGDQLIKEISKRMKNVFSRKEDIVARYGGDEFVILCNNLNIETFQKKCNKMLTEIRRQVRIDSKIINVTASIGGYFTDGYEKENAVELLSRVDSVMYRAKHKGRDRTVIEQNIKQDVNEIH